MSTKTFERTDLHGVPRTERLRLVNDLDEYLDEVAVKAKRITVTVEVEVRGER